MSPAALLARSLFLQKLLVSQLLLLPLLLHLLLSHILVIRVRGTWWVLENTWHSGSCVSKGA